MAQIPITYSAPLVVDKITDAEILCIARKDNALYIGTNGRGLFEKENNAFSNISNKFNLRDNVIHEIELMEDKILLATDLGLAICAQNSSTNLTMDEGLSDNLILALSRISDDEIMMGMHNGSACILNIKSNEVRPIEGLALLSTNPIHQIDTPGEYKLLINSNDEVFMMKKEDKIQHFNFNKIKTDTWKSITDFIISSEGNFIAANGSGSLL